MRKLNKLWILGLCSMVGYSGAFAQMETVRINEILARNETILTDEDGDYSDWIELYNAGPDPVDLTGWFLTDDAADSLKWSIPGVTIDTDGYLLIFASGKDRNSSGSELHTNFKLSVAGEYLALFNPEGISTTAFKPSFPVQQTDISYGFIEGGYTSISAPTPESENMQAGIILPPPQFSVNHGIFENPFDLEISSGFEGADIYYTLDGSTPLVGTGKYYTSAIHIDTSTILRAVAVLDDTNFSEVITRSYLFLDDVIRQSNHPAGYPSAWGPYTAIGGTSIADYEMDPDIMADPDDAATVKEGLESLPTMSLVTDISNLFSSSTDPETGGIYIYTGPPLSNTEYGLGKGWERPASLEYFDADGTESFQVNCGVRTQGGHSRRPEKSPKHSFRIVFRSEYGPSKLKFPLFKDTDATTTFNSIVLRAGFCLSWIHHDHNQRIQTQYQRDIWSKDTQRAMGHPSSHSEYVHLYINGIYWGIYAPSERLDSDFAASYLDGEPEDYDVIKDYLEVIDGEKTAWNTMMEMANAGLESNEAYQQIQGNNPDGSRNPEMESMLDVMNLADYMLINFYGSNTDWDHHNWAATRNRVKPGTGFKFLSWDAEHLLKTVDGNVLNENNDYCPSRIFQQLSKNEAFRQLFADRVQQLCYHDGLLTPESAADRWNTRKDQVENGIPAESARWGDYRRDVHPYQTSGPFDLYSYDDYWVPQHNFMLNTYFPERTSAFLNQLRSAGLFPDLDAPAFFVNGQAYPGTTIEKGDELTMTSGEGVIYYTTNGKDPVDWGFLESGPGKELISEDAVKYVLVPKSNIGPQWQRELDYDDSSWALCSGAPGGIGYEKESGYEELISLDVSADMHETGTEPNNSCYIRIPFTIESGDLDNLEALYLNIRYDDGFMVFLNGTMVAKNNLPILPAWNSAASESHEASGSEVFNISDFLNQLIVGENLLAIHAMNDLTSSPDFLFMAGMMATEQSSSKISADAHMYDVPVILDHSSHIMARTYLDGKWSAMMNSFVSFTDDYRDIKVTEIHYNPLDEDTIAGSEFEFIELKNTGVSTLDLGGMSVDDGVEYTFPPEFQLIPGGFAVVASSEMNFYDRYGFFPDGEFKGNLNNTGEQIRIKGGPGGEALILLMYDNQAPWPLLADGSGNSLVPVELNPDGDPNLPQNWRNSHYIGGSPGTDDTEATSVEDHTPDEPGFKLGQNYPNPFGEVTYISYQLPAEAWVDLSVYNLVGQKVAVLETGRQAAGHHVLTWNGKDDSGQVAEQGIYFYRMVVRGSDGTHSETRKMIRF